MRDERRRRACWSAVLSFHSSLIPFTKGKENMMEENERQNKPTNEEQQPTDELSPSEKLEDVKPTGSLVPGAENPESKEIKREINPNTE
jgi:hypothetical protein